MVNGGVARGSLASEVRPRPFWFAAITAPITRCCFYHKAAPPPSLLLADVPDAAWRRYRWQLAAKDGSLRLCAVTVFK